MDDVEKENISNKLSVIIYFFVPFKSSNSLSPTRNNGNKYTVSIHVVITYSDKVYPEKAYKIDNNIFKLSFMFLKYLSIKYRLVSEDVTIFNATTIETALYTNSLGKNNSTSENGLNM